MGTEIGMDGRIVGLEGVWRRAQAAVIGMCAMGVRGGASCGLRFSNSDEDRTAQAQTGAHWR